ncbi:hypothetical protein UFOVP249_8 [uncultured Caudovirales phage]|uniref:Uncharacterized protein n=1 Tax=uncultured Caudovirales phage TaxID=2100421 RepID=A0A6J5LHW5_9CAUD|nr:hypothetical protein UFOVP249_8 [uncultured Caudovirales phage]
MIFSSSNHEDINRYYRNTFVKFKETGDTLYYIRQVSREVVRGTDETGTEFELWLSDEHPYEVDYILPNKSYFRYKKRACMLMRIPARQYQRGLSAGNTRVQSMGRSGGTTLVELDFPLLMSFVSKQKFLKIDQAVLNKARDHSIVLSSRFAYLPDTKTIYADHIAVASVIPEEQKIVVRHPIFLPELKSLASNTNYQVS